MLSSEVATSHLLHCRLKLIKRKENEKFTPPVTLATFQVLSGHMDLVATTVNSVDRKLGCYE